MAGTTVGEFVLSLVVDAGKGELTIGNLVASMGELEVASVGEIAVLAELANKLASVADHTIKTSEAFTDYSAATGASTDALQKWANVAEHVGISGEVVAKALESVSSGIEGLKHFGVQSDLANLLLPLHMSLEKYKSAKPEELLHDIRENVFFQSMDASTKKYVLARAHLDGLLRVLSKDSKHGGVSPANFKAWSTEGLVLNEADIKKYDTIHEKLVSIRQLTEKIGFIIMNWFSKDFMVMLDGAVSSLKAAAGALAAVEKRKTKNENELGPLKYVPAGAEIHGLQMAYGSAMANFLGLSDKENPFLNPVSPAAKSAMLENYSKGNTVVNFRPTAVVNGSHLNESQLTLVIKKVFGEMVNELPAQIDAGKKR